MAATCRRRPFALRAAPRVVEAPITARTQEQEGPPMTVSRTMKSRAPRKLDKKIILYLPDSFDPQVHLPLPEGGPIAVVLRAIPPKAPGRSVERQPRPQPQVHGEQRRHAGSPVSQGPPA